MNWVFQYGREWVCTSKLKSKRTLALTIQPLNGTNDGLKNKEKTPVNQIKSAKQLVELEAELAKRPVVYCYRNKHGELARHFGSESLALWAIPEKQEATNPELDWKIEIYTGEQRP